MIFALFETVRRAMVYSIAWQERQNNKLHLDVMLFIVILKFHRPCVGVHQPQCCTSLLPQVVGLTNLVGSRNIRNYQTDAVKVIRE